jgi:hypothetical protein
MSYNDYERSPVKPEYVRFNSENTNMTDATSSGVLYLFRYGASLFTRTFVNGVAVDSAFLSGDQSVNTTDDVTFESITVNRIYDAVTGFFISFPTLVSSAYRFVLSTTHDVFFTTSGPTTLVVPTSGTVATLAGVENFSNKTFVDPIDPTKVANLYLSSHPSLTYATILTNFTPVGTFPTLNQNTTGTAALFSGSLTGDVTGTQSSTVVSTVGGSSAADIHTATDLALAATDAADPDTLVYRNSSGDVALNNLTLWGTALQTGGLTSDFYIANNPVGGSLVLEAENVAFHRYGAAYRLIHTGYENITGSNKIITWADLSGTPILTAGAQTMTDKTLTAPVIASIKPSASYTHTVPDVASDTFALLAATQTLSNKTLTTPVIASIKPSASYTHTVPNVASDTFALLSAAQTLTNKNLDYSDLRDCNVPQYYGIFMESDGNVNTIYQNPLTGSRATYFGNFGGVIVTDSSTQTLTNKTLTSPIFSKYSH